MDGRYEQQAQQEIRTISSIIEEGGEGRTRNISVRHEGMRDELR
jgi:hypothetical protein